MHANKKNCAAVKDRCSRGPESSCIMHVLRVKQPQEAASVEPQEPTDVVRQYFRIHALKEVMLS